MKRCGDVEGVEMLDQDERLNIEGAGVLGPKKRDTAADLNHRGQRRPAANPVLAYTIKAFSG